MKNEVEKINSEEFGLNKDQALKITKGLEQIISERSTLEEQYSEVIKLEITKENIPKFKALRLQISKNRTQGINKWHEANKEFWLRGGQFVDAIKRKEVAENERMEKNLMSNEKHFENLEKERLKKLQESREEELLKYVDDVTGRNLSGMDSDVWDAFIETKKNEHTALLEAEKKAEEERFAKEKAEAEERVRIEKENAELKAKAEKEKALRLAEEEKSRVEAANIKAKADKVQAELQKKLDAEKAIRLKVERAEVERKAEEKRKADADYALQLAEEQVRIEEEDRKAKAPIKEKMNLWVESFNLPEVSVDNGASRDIIEKFNAFKKWSKDQVNSL